MEAVIWINLGQNYSHPRFTMMDCNNISSKLNENDSFINVCVLLNFNVVGLILINPGSLHFTPKEPKRINIR